MAKQLQLRRGTTVQNDAFTGAIGELTMDTEKNQLRVHDGVTRGGHIFGDTVVEWQVPTAENGYTWYRKYRSGWVEQGGRITLNGAISATNKRVTFPIEMANTRYYSIAALDANTGNTSIAVGWQGTTGMSVGTVSGASTGTTSWEVKGMAA